MLRLSVIIQALDFASNALKNVTDRANDEITETFIIEAKNIARNIPSTAFIIDETTLKLARRLTEYFNLNKLILCSYNVEPTSTFDDAYIRLINSRPKPSNEVATKFLTYSKQVIRHMTKVLKLKSTKINAAILSNGNLPIEKVNEIFKNLEDLNLGRQGFCCRLILN